MKSNLPQAGEAFLAKDGSVGAQERALEDAVIGSLGADVEHLATSFLVGVVSCIPETSTVNV